MAPSQTQPADKDIRTDAEPCSTPIDRTAPAGSRNSLGAKSDCGGRPTSDDSVVEAKDEMGPGVTPPAERPRDAGR
jgi:hypothetical protein